MADAGAVAAAVRAIAEDSAQAGTDIGEALGTNIDDAAQNVLDGLATSQAAEDANTQLFRDIKPNAGDVHAAGGAGGDTAGSGVSGEPNRIAQLLDGTEPGKGSADKLVPVSAENGSPRLFKRLFPELTDVNAPRFGQGPEWQRNCQSCVNAVDHTLDGNPVSAVPRPPQGFPWPDSVTKTIGGGKPFVRVGSYDDITDQMTKAGDGARGVVWGQRFRQLGSRSIEVEGHVFNVVNRGGRVFYVDGQTGTFARLENFGILNLLRTK